MSGNINGSQLDCSTRGDRLRLLSLQFRVLIYRLSLLHLPCDNIRRTNVGFLYSTALFECCSSFCLNTNCSDMSQDSFSLHLLPYRARNHCAFGFSLFYDFKRWFLCTDASKCWLQTRSHSQKIPSFRQLLCGDIKPLLDIKVISKWFEEEWKIGVWELQVHSVF